ncbi:MAG: serine protease [Patescibacteria group bacterium]|nr:serine protease [Patescibacteria group bacterium]
MAKNRRRVTFKSRACGTFATCTMIVLYALLIIGLLSGNRNRTPEALIIHGDLVVVPPEEAEEAPEAPVDPDESSLDSILVTAPGSVKKMKASARPVTEVTYHIKAFSEQGNAYLGSGSGFMVRPDTMITAAHVVEIQSGLVRVYCTERNDGLIGSVNGRVIEIDPTFDLAVVDVTDCPFRDPVRLAKGMPGPNRTLHTYGFSSTDNRNILSGDHFLCTYVSGANWMRGKILNGETLTLRDKQISPYLGGITAECRYGNSGGPVFRADNGEVVGVAVTLDPRSRSFIVKVPSIRRILARSGR